MLCSRLMTNKNSCLCYGMVGVFGHGIGQGCPVKDGGAAENSFINQCSIGMLMSSDRSNLDEDYWSNFGAETIGVKLVTASRQLLLISGWHRLICKSFNWALPNAQSGARPTLWGTRLGIDYWATISGQSFNRPTIISTCPLRRLLFKGDQNIARIANAVQLRKS